jgi:CIC family chloride channel protein
MTTKGLDILSKFLIWRIRFISDRNFVLILSGVVGCIAGLAAVALKLIVHWIHFFLTENQHLSSKLNYFAIFPLIGLLITYLLAKYVFKEKLGHGVSTILYSISKGSSKLKKRLTISRLFTSAITVGFGGSVGLESPIVVTGSAIGSNIARSMHLNYRRRTLLIGCGAAAAVAGIFDSPVAGLIFAIEVVLSEISIRKFIPLLIASVCGSLMSLMFLGDDLLFHFKATEAFSAAYIPHFIGLGIFCGIVALYFTRMHYFVEGLVGKINNGLARVLVGGSGLVLLIYLFPQLYGEGYDVLTSLLQNNGDEFLQETVFMRFESWYLFVAFILALMLIKAIASALTIGSGGSGGIFGPSLFIGGMSGFFYYKILEAFNLTDGISSNNFTLVGMCGVMSGVLHAPLTAIFLIAEITGGYTLFIPLMLVSAIAYTTIYYFEKNSIYTKHLIEKGDLIVDDRDRELLSLLDRRKLIEKDFKPVHPDSTLGDLTELVKVSHRHVFPVVDTECMLVGTVSLDDIRSIMFDQEKHGELLVKSIMQIPKVTIGQDDRMSEIMAKFEQTGAWNLPVVKDDIYIGFFSKSKIFNAYRKRLIRQNTAFDE